MRKKLVPHGLFILFLILNHSNIKAQKYPEIGAQIFIEPGQTDEEIESWFKKLKDLGMPVCRIRLFQNHMDKGNDNWDFSLYDHVFDMADKYGIKVCPTLFSNPNFKLPGSEEDLKNLAHYISKVVPHFKNKPALDTWVLLNEPGVEARYFTKTPYMDLRFDEWKKLRKNIISNNEYSKATPLWDLFLRDFTTWSLAWRAKEVRKYDKIHGLHTNNHMLVELLSQYNFPDWMEFLTTLGASMHPSWHFRYFNRDQYNLGISAFCDIIQNAANPRPFWITELQGGNNLFSGFQPMCPTVNDMSSWLWTGIGSGAQKIIFWTLNPRATGGEAAEWAMVNAMNQPSDRLLEASRIAKVIEKQSGFFRNANPVHSDITLLYSPESMIIQNNRSDEAYVEEARRKGAHIKSILSYYEALLQLGYSPKLSQMDNFDWQVKTEVPRMAILANAISIPSYQVDSIYQFVENGNHLIASGLTGFYDENNHAVMVSGSPLSELFGGVLLEMKTIKPYFKLNLDCPQVSLNTHLWQGTIYPQTGSILGKSKNDIIALQNQIGKGNVTWIPSMIGLGGWQQENSGLVSFLSNRIKQANITPLPFSFERDYNKVFMKVLKSGKRYITIVVNSNNVAKEIQLAYDQKLTPFIIDGNGKINSNLLKVPALGTLVVIWQ